MKKTVFGVVVLLLAANLAWAGCLFGAKCGPATRYDVKVTEVALCSDAACSSRYVVGSGAKTFDIASGTAGSALGSYAKVDSAPNGVYTHVQIIIDSTFVLAGPIPTGSACAAPLTATAISIPNDGSVDLNAIQMSWHDPATKTQIAGIKQLPTPVVMAQGAKRPSVMVKFDTQEGLMCVGGAYKPGLPSITLSVF